MSVRLHRDNITSKHLTMHTAFLSTKNKGNQHEAVCKRDQHLLAATASSRLSNLAVGSRAAPGG
eukprot:scaffold661487_cov59-Prasinocladus_malaysianus.AAC.1